MSERRGIGEGKYVAICVLQKEEERLVGIGGREERKEREKSEKRDKGKRQNLLFLSFPDTKKTCSYLTKMDHQCPIFWLDHCKRDLFLVCLVHDGYNGRTIFGSTAWSTFVHRLIHCNEKQRWR